MAEADMNAAELPLETAGSRMRRAREEAGLSLADIAARTKIPERSLAAIEQGDYAALPARTYAVGFSRSYARAVGLDGEEIVGLVRSELSGVEAETEARPVNTFEPGDPARVPSGGVVLIAVLAAVALLLGLLVVWRSYLSPGASLPSLAPAEQAAAPTATTSAAPAPAAPVGGAVVFTALAPDIWVKFYDGQGVQLLQKQLAQGESYTVPAEAQDPKIWTGRPEALAITIGGQPVAKLADVQKTVKDMPVSAAALLARSAPAAPVAGDAASAAAPVAAPVAAPAPQMRAAPQPRQIVRRAPAAAAPAAVAAPAPAPVAAPAADAAPPQSSTVTQ